LYREACMATDRERMNDDATVLDADAPNRRENKPDTVASPASAPPCQIVKGSGQHFSDEVHEILRQRLRIACSIAFAGFAIFFVRSFFMPVNVGGPDAIDNALQIAVVAILGFLCALLWTTYPLSHEWLRTAEIVMFGSMAVYFADLQFRVYYPGKIVDLARPEGVERILSLNNTANNMRWFFVIVLYGMFIPNTWRRCALVVGCLALMPIVLTLVLCWNCPVMGPFVGTHVFSTLIVMSMACAMAIFGSYRISVLHEEAYQARKLNQYQLHRKLGAGGMGEVYLGEHTLLKRTCAIKLIRPEQAGDPTTLLRFEREVQAMATLTHPNTVEIYDYGHAADGTFYYVMEYLPGLSLQELVDLHGPLAPGRAIHFLRQICGALKEAHSIGLIHRDIKPSNVIACQRGGIQDVAKLLDFGLVQDIGGFAAGNERLTGIGAIVGSPNYLSPEQAIGKGQIDSRTDIYSLGAVAYFLVTGQPPFRRDTPMELVAAHMKDPAPPPRELRPELPIDLEEVILMCLRKNPDERFADMESLDLALAACESANDWTADRARDWWRSKANTVAA